MKAPRHLLFSLLLLLAPTLLARADDADHDPDSPTSNQWHLTTTRWIGSHQGDVVFDVEPATLIGQARKQYEKFIYIFADATGTIELYSEIQLPLHQPIVVRGDIDEGKLIVKSWRPVARPAKP